jgi:hypothetical protein
MRTSAQHPAAIRMSHHPHGEPPATAPIAHPLLGFSKPPHSALSFLKTLSVAKCEPR